MDVMCAKCGEPWDCKPGGTPYDMDAHEAKQFRAGQGCPSCDYGRSLPLMGQYEAKRGPLSVWRDYPNVYRSRYDPQAPMQVLSGSLDKTTLECQPGMIASVEYVDYEGIGGYSSPAVRFTCNGEYLACTEKDFRRMFPNKIQTEQDMRHAENLAYQATLQAMDATDEDPMGVLEERGWF